MQCQDANLGSRVKSGVKTKPIKVKRGRFTYKVSRFTIL